MADKLITKVPENYEWEIHNLNAYADKKKAFAEGKITELQLREFEHKYRESEEQREGRWRREHVLREMHMQNAQDYREFKENPKSFLTKMADIGRHVSEWWVRRPKKPVPGKGKLVQNSITGAWQQEYRPSKSMNMRAWLDAANQGKVMRHMNPQGKSLDRQPTEEEKGISAEMKRTRGKKVWQWLLKETDNFGRGWTDPKWGKLYKGEPGRGGRYIKPKKYSIK